MGKRKKVLQSLIEKGDAIAARAQESAAAQPTGLESFNEEDWAGSEAQDKELRALQVDERVDTLIAADYRMKSLSSDYRAEADRCRSEGERRLQQGDRRGAIQVLSRSLELYPTDEGVLLLRSLAHYDEGLFDASLVDALMVLNFDTKCGEAYYRAGLAYAQKRYHSAISAFSSAQATKRKSKKVDLAKKEVATLAIAVSKSRESAKEIYKEALSAALREKDSERALRMATDAVELDPVHHQYRAFRAGLLLDAGRPADALRDVEVAVFSCRRRNAYGEAARMFGQMARCYEALARVEGVAVCQRLAQTEELKHLIQRRDNKAPKAYEDLDEVDAMLPSPEGSPVVPRRKHAWDAIVEEEVNELWPERLKASGINSRKDAEGTKNLMLQLFKSVRDYHASRTRIALPPVLLTEADLAHDGIGRLVSDFCYLPTRDEAIRALFGDQAGPAGTEDMVETARTFASRCNPVNGRRTLSALSDGSEVTVVEPRCGTIDFVFGNTDVQRAFDLCGAELKLGQDTFVRGSHIADAMRTRGGLCAEAADFMTAAIARLDEENAAQRPDATLASRFFHDEKCPRYEVWTRELVGALARHLLDSAEVIHRRTGEQEVLVLEVGAGDGRLSFLLSNFLANVLEGSPMPVWDPDDAFGAMHGPRSYKVVFAATDGNVLPDSEFSFRKVQELDCENAVGTYKPQIVLCSWMPPYTDWTALFRARPEVCEYILIGPPNDSLAGDAWKTWGAGQQRVVRDEYLRAKEQGADPVWSAPGLLAIFAEQARTLDERKFGPLPPNEEKELVSIAYEADGFARLDVPGAAQGQLCRRDGPREGWFSSTTTSFRRDAVFGLAAP